MTVLRTARLDLRELDVDDAPFIVELLNDAGFLRHIGDKGVRTLDDARRYLEQGPIDSYRRHGFGLYAVCLHEGTPRDGTPIGICGLVRRDGLEDPDVGFAYLERYRGRGYAVEAAHAVMDFGRNILNLPRIVAITSPDNTASMAVLVKIGLTFERFIRIGEDRPQVRLFS